VINVLDSRETKDVQKALDEYPNLIIVSRDRGKQYQSLSNSYIHIADRFHLIKNLSERILKEIKSVFPKRIFIKEREIEVKTSKPRKKKKNDKSESQLNKIKLVKLTKETYNRIGTYRGTARELNLHRKTVRKYILMADIHEEIKITRERSCMLDSYSEEIFKLYDEGKKITKIQAYLNSKYINLNVKYGRLSFFIRKYRQSDQKQSHKKIYLNRGKLIKSILGWKVKVTPDEEGSIKKIVADHSKLEELKDFYELFRISLTDNKVSIVKDILETNYENITINEFIENLKTDYDAVVNSAKYAFNNGQTEGNVGKLKKIKHDMFGRGGIQLLKKKVIFQSFF
jgi:hypothetical protein